MTQPATYATMTLTEARLHRTFNSLMWALAYPGRARALPVSGTRALRCVADALVDLETSYYTPDERFRAELAETGGRAAPIERAAYHFYPTFGEADLPNLSRMSSGTHLQPDQSATIIILAEHADAPRDPSWTSLRLRGPGVPDVVALATHGLPRAFWTVRAENLSFPLGWDVFLIDGDQLVGLPRTTSVEVL